MDRDELTHRKAPEKVEEVPTSPCASYEKPRVPLNNLKMKFERREDFMSKVNVFWCPVGRDMGHMDKK